MTQSKIVITKGRAADAIGIQDVYYRAWLETYPNRDIGITQADIEDWFKDRYAAHVMTALRERLVSIREGDVTFVARDDERVVGVCRMRRHSDCNELKTLYVLPDYKRQKVGARLLIHALDFANRRQSTLADVASYNMDAIAFYRAYNFRQNGSITHSTKFKFKSGAIMPLVTMVRDPDLGPPSKIK